MKWEFFKFDFFDVFADVTVVVVDVEHPIKIYDYVYDEEIKLIQRTNSAEFAWRITTWDDMDYNDHSSSTTKSCFIFDETAWKVLSA